jgi:hypothetical protein
MAWFSRFMIWINLAILLLYPVRMGSWLWCKSIVKREVMASKILKKKTTLYKPCDHQSLERLKMHVQYCSLDSSRFQTLFRTISFLSEFTKEQDEEKLLFEAIVQWISARIVKNIISCLNQIENLEEC